MASDYFVDGALQLTFYSGGLNRPMVQINEPGESRYVALPLELFYHMLQDKQLKIEINKRYYDQRSNRRHASND